MKPTLTQFQNIIWDYYHKEGRHLLWRTPEHTGDPYKILVSEIMLQQTQVARINIKYPEFISMFPNFKILAKAPLVDVLKVWQGMGYNRRAIALQKIAIIVMKEFASVLPQDPEVLETFPGIGPHTAGSIAAFAFNKPAVFIETNIRRVFIHFFFPRTKQVSDDKIRPLVAKTLDHKNPREWYFALMDYGAKLAKEVKNPNRKSAAYRRQSKFEGSLRQVRGAILKVLVKNGSISLDQLFTLLCHPERVQRVEGSLQAAFPPMADPPLAERDSSSLKVPQNDIGRLQQALDALVKEGFVIRNSNLYTLVS